METKEQILERIKKAEQAKLQLEKQLEEEKKKLVEIESGFDKELEKLVSSVVSFNKNIYKINASDNKNRDDLIALLKKMNRKSISLQLNGQIYDISYVPVHKYQKDFEVLIINGNVKSYLNPLISIEDFELGKLSVNTPEMFISDKTNILENLGDFNLEYIYKVYPTMESYIKELFILDYIQNKIDKPTSKSSYRWAVEFNKYTNCLSDYDRDFVNTVFKGLIKDDRFKNYGITIEKIKYQDVEPTEPANLSDSNYWRVTYDGLPRLPLMGLVRNKTNSNLNKIKIPSTKKTKTWAEKNYIVACIDEYLSKGIDSVCIQDKTIGIEYDAPVYFSTRELMDRINNYFSTVKHVDNIIDHPSSLVNRLLYLKDQTDKLKELGITLNKDLDGVNKTVWVIAKINPIYKEHKIVQNDIDKTLENLSTVIPNTIDNTIVFPEPTTYHINQGIKDVDLNLPPEYFKFS